MKKILEVAYPALNNSGVPSVIMGIIRGLKEEFIFDILVFRKDVGYYEKEFKSYGGKIHLIDCDKKNSRIGNIFEKLIRPFKLYFGVRKILRNNNYDVIHCHNGWDAAWCLWAARNSKIKLRIMHSHGSKNPFDNGFYVTIYHKICTFLINKNANKGISCSTIAAESIFKSLPYKIILNGVNLDKFHSKSDNIIKSTNEHPRFVFVGRLSIQKNPYFLLEVFFLILKKLPNSTLKIIGFGEYENGLKLKVKEYNILKNVEFLPHNSDIPKILENSDIFILPSFWEGLPIVLIEAQFMNVYCFASDSIAKEADLGLCKFLSLNCGAEFWANEIVTFWNSIRSNKSISTAKLLNYTWNNIIKEYRNIYETE